jgi:hypothetical protein
MRFTIPVVALIAAVLLAACGGSVAAPKPDPAGDAAFVTALKLLCAKTPSLVPIDPSASMAAITSAANANNTTVLNFVYGPPFRGPHGRIERNGGLAALTPTISSTSPLVLPVTDAAEMLIDMSKWYGMIVKPAKIDDHQSNFRTIWALTVTRGSQARGDFAKIGISGCPN